MSAASEYISKAMVSSANVTTTKMVLMVPSVAPNAAESVKQPGANGRYISEMGQRWSNRAPLVSVERLIIVS